MQMIIATALIILLVSLTTNANDSLRNDQENDMLKEILQRMEKMQSHMDQVERNNQIRFDQMERNNKIRFDKVEGQLDRLQRQIDQLETKNNIGFGQFENETKNLTVVMETIVEQQMVITAEIFTVSQTLPFCCCQYQNKTDPPEIETTTSNSGKPDTTTDSGIPETTKPTTLTTLHSDCTGAMGENGADGIYQINVTTSNIGPFDVYCMKNIVDCKKEKDISGPWMLIQRRQDNNTDFYQNWKMYQRGFGELTNSFWIGLDKLYALTQQSTVQELWIRLENHQGLMGWAIYSLFSIGSESEKYALKGVGLYKGTAGDSLSYSVGAKWSTFDQDNDENIYSNLAEYYKGAWWIKERCESNLNSIYGSDEGIHWSLFEKSKVLKYAHMAIRPRK